MEPALELEPRTPVQGPKHRERPGPDSGYGSSIHRRPQRLSDSPEVVVGKFSLPGAGCESGPNSPAAAALADESGCSLLQEDEEPVRRGRARAASPEQRGAATDSEPPAPARAPVKRPCGQCSNSVWKVIAGVAVAVAVAILTGTFSRKVRQCPEEWICFRGNCYYFSTDTKSWDDSKKYCASHGATLPVIKDKLQLENIKRLRQNHYYWIGLRKEAAGWQWDDGSPFTNDIIQLENEDAKLKCSFLNSDKIVTVDCTSSRRWICVKESK
ncbi:C-type lectin domain family 2 member L-like [Mauremys reevesii]|uniref:C-type lectin domain family 2 member L-like n=1 Tax=Mauremys reevesii TaxID=260615 RepID=UPI00193F35AB|nr:C-type lectin domain family 2 member L-like [Mauremys reevesii]XP_039379078.1 C-type lectin domain family 2 member L-like [Mauremys reevesii]